MTNVITIGRRLIAIDQIAFIEPFDPASASGIETSRKFEARVNLLNRDSCLTETTVGAFAGEHKFRLLPNDGVAINPLVDFRVETFEPTGEFAPAKAFKTRLLWRDHRGIDYSKLLLTSPEEVLAATTAAETAAASDAAPAESPKRGTCRRSAQSKRASRQPA